MAANGGTGLMKDKTEMALTVGRKWRFIECPSKDTAMEIAAEYVTASLDLEVEKTGAARLMLSGGGTPKPLYEILSQAELNWPSIICGLVDERWVPEDHSASNASLVRQTLIKDAAKDAIFLPMTDGSETAAEGAQTVSQLYLAAGQPITVSILGMGADGHCASWFPASPDLHAVTAPNAKHWVMPVDASDCPGAGEIRERITLSRSAVLGSQLLVLLIIGENKRSVFDRAVGLYEDTGDIHTLPVCGLFEAGERLIVIWAP